MRPVACQCPSEIADSELLRSVIRRANGKREELEHCASAVLRVSPTNCGLEFAIGSQWQEPVPESTKLFPASGINCQSYAFDLSVSLRIPKAVASRSSLLGLGGPKGR